MAEIANRSSLGKYLKVVFEMKKLGKKKNPLYFQNCTSLVKTS